MNSAEFIAEGVRLSKLLDDALAFGKRMVREYAAAEKAYREAKSEAWVQVKLKLGESSLAAERDSWVSGVTAKHRETRDVAEGMKQMSIEAIRSRRAQLSALQTFANMEREERSHERFGPDAA